MIFWVAVASIAAVIAAAAAIASAVIYLKTFQSVNSQTEISRRQFEQAELDRREATRPRLTVEISKWEPPNAREMRGDITFALRNAGQIGFRIVSARTQSGNTHNQDVALSIDVHSGHTAYISANILPIYQFNPPALKAWFEIEAPGYGRRRHHAEWLWNSRSGEFELLKSQLEEV
jgi:hypothetical protein